LPHFGSIGIDQLVSTGLSYTDLFMNIMNRVSLRLIFVGMPKYTQR